ncbi:hypothetical protein G5S35_08355 [Paraburkholderia tropica]|uniref:hypothetical protein n=1 Tax=Paraburkholderia tropica TaxID=92647 RepID=UPI001601CF4D|nr:hypothetical protein [Paraburkholderia tropica]QNB11588.1 hypothetical protein G5S35_08355 [Paraburkholderia tropica]
MDLLTLIELAAAAAKFEHRRHRVRDVEAIHVRAVGARSWRFFDPLNRDADMAELSSILRIDVTHFSMHIAASGGDSDPATRQFAFDEIYVGNGDDESAQRRRAVRRAVTECAAKIGQVARGEA